MPVVTVLYITKTDFIGGGKGFYQTVRKLQGSGRTVGVGVDNGIHERFFNLRYPTSDERINELLHYLKDSDPYYQTEYFPRIVERVRFYKHQEKGVNEMCEITDRIRQEGKIEGKIEVVLELLEEVGKIQARIVQRISQEKDLAVISRWIRCAASASSIAEFEAKM